MSDEDIPTTDPIDPTDDGAPPETPPDSGGGPAVGDPAEPPPTTPDPTPEAPGPGDSIAWEPRTWYTVTVACLTANCSEENVVKSAPLYSNDGKAKNIRVNCGVCRVDCKNLTATKQDPQPEEE